MNNSVKAGTFENEAGDRVIVNYHTSTSKAYEDAGYKLVENSDEVTAASFAAADVLTRPVPAEGEPSEDARSRDPEDAPADPSAVAYPAGQLPRETVANAGAEMEGITDRTMQDSQPDGNGGTVPLVDSYDTPPTPDRNPSPERREAMREANAEAGIVDERGVHEHQEGESAGGPVAESDAGMVATPDDLKAENVVKESQGANKNAESQGTARPSARSRSKS